MPTLGRQCEFFFCRGSDEATGRNRAATCSTLACADQSLGLQQNLYHDNFLGQSALVQPDWYAAHQHPQIFTNPAINTTHVPSGHGQPTSGFVQGLNNHTCTAAHNALPTCTNCNKTFSRPDALKRHLASSCNFNANNRDRVRFSCDLCDPGTKTFQRRDHLLQHLRVYHKMSEGAVDRYKIRSGKKTAVENDAAEDGFEE
jgi:hypothetical protein